MSTLNILIHPLDKNRLLYLFDEKILSLFMLNLINTKLFHF